jgi:hypothetical protein
MLTNKTFTVFLLPSEESPIVAACFVASWAVFHAIHGSG